MVPRGKGEWWEACWTQGAVHVQLACWWIKILLTLNPHFSLTPTEPMAPYMEKDLFPLWTSESVNLLISSTLMTSLFWGAEARRISGGDFFDLGVAGATGESCGVWRWTGLLGGLSKPLITRFGLTLGRGGEWSWGVVAAGEGGRWMEMGGGRTCEGGGSVSGASRPASLRNSSKSMNSSFRSASS